MAPKKKRSKKKEELEARAAKHNPLRGEAAAPQIDSALAQASHRAKLQALVQVALRQREIVR